MTSSLDQLNMCVVRIIKSFGEVITKEMPRFDTDKSQLIALKEAIDAYVALPENYAPAHESPVDISVNHRLSAEKLQTVVKLVTNLSPGLLDRVLNNVRRFAQIKDLFFNDTMPAIQTYGLALREELGIESALLIHTGIKTSRRGI